MRNRLEWHRLKAYRYRVARPGVRVGLNRYPGVVIGLFAVLGGYAYCLKWGWARGQR